MNYLYILLVTVFQLTNASASLQETSPLLPSQEIGHTQAIAIQVVPEVQTSLQQQAGQMHQLQPRLTRLEGVIARPWLRTFLHVFPTNISALGAAGLGFGLMQESVPNICAGLILAIGGEVTRVLYDGASAAYAAQEPLTLKSISRAGLLSPYYLPSFAGRLVCGFLYPNWVWGEATLAGDFPFMLTTCFSVFLTGVDIDCCWEQSKKLRDKLVRLRLATLPQAPDNPRGS